MYKVKDNAEAQLQFGISSVATTLVVKEGQGDKFPGVPFLVVLNKRNSDWEITKSEKIEVTAKNWDQLTVKRGFEWTTPSDFSADDFVSLFVLARHIEDLQTEVDGKANQTDLDSVSQRTRGEGIPSWGEGRETRGSWYSWSPLNKSYRSWSIQREWWSLRISPTACLWSHIRLPNLKN